MKRRNLPGIDVVVGNGEGSAGSGRCRELPGCCAKDLRGGVGGLGVWVRRTAGKQAGDESSETKGGEGEEATGYTGSVRS
jgi:hypothetical protein